MRLSDSLFFFLYFELFFAVAFIFLIGIFRIRNNLKIDNQKKRREKFSSYIFSLLENPSAEVSPLPCHKRIWRKAILEVLESFNVKIKGENWNEIKKRFVFKCLLPQARQYASSYSWKKRNYAARVFALYPLQEDEDTILKMMDDSEFIVRSPASLAGVYLGSEVAIHKSVYAIAENKGFEHYFYQDILLSAPNQVFEKILNFAQDPHLKKACLSVLAPISWPGSIQFLKADLESPDPEIRKLAYLVLLRNEFKDREEFFKRGLNDIEPEIRRVSIQGISNYPLEPYIPRLIELLNDPFWPVRLIAGYHLNRFDEGKTLSSQSTPLSKQVSEYLKEFGSSLTFRF